MDNIDVSAFGLIIIPGDVCKFGCNPERPLRIFLITFLRCHSHTADTGLQIQQFIDIRSIFHQDVFACHANICSAALNIDGNIRRLDPEVAYFLFRIFKNQLPVFLQDLRTFITGFRKRLIDLLAQTSLWERHIQKGLLFFCCIPCFFLQVIQLICIDRKPYSTGAAVHFFH